MRKKNGQNTTRKIEQREPHWKPWVNSSVQEVLTFPAPPVVPTTFVLFFEARQKRVLDMLSKIVMSVSISGNDKSMVNISSSVQEVLTFPAPPVVPEYITFTVRRMCIMQTQRNYRTCLQLIFIILTNSLYSFLKRKTGHKQDYINTHRRPPQVYILCDYALYIVF
jgi:hypothetical protein